MPYQYGYYLLLAIAISWCVVVLAGLIGFELWQLYLPIRGILWWSFGTGEPPQ